MSGVYRTSLIHVFIDQVSPCGRPMKGQKLIEKMKDSKRKSQELQFGIWKDGRAYVSARPCRESQHVVVMRIWLVALCWCASIERCSREVGGGGGGVGGRVT